jgi:hypothetical protein
MNKDIKEAANIKPGPSKEIFLHYYKELWNNNFLQENYWDTENVDDQRLAMEELKTVLKMENYIAEIK